MTYDQKVVRIDFLVVSRLRLLNSVDDIQAFVVKGSNSFVVSLVLAPIVCSQINAQTVHHRMHKVGVFYVLVIEIFIFAADGEELACKIANDKELTTDKAKAGKPCPLMS